MPVFVFEKRQRVSIKAPSEEFAQQVAESDAALWDVGTVELIDTLDEEQD